MLDNDNVPTNSADRRIGFWDVSEVLVDAPICKDVTNAFPFVYVPAPVYPICSVVATGLVLRTVISTVFTTYAFVSNVYVVLGAHTI